MSRELAIFFIGGGAFSFGYLLPQSIRAWRDEQIKLPLVRPFLKKNNPALYWFGFVSSLTGFILSAAFVIAGFATLASK